MRVLLLHNRYRLAGGEERAVRDIAGLLRSHGHAVKLIERSSARLGASRAAVALLAGGVDPGEVSGAVRGFAAEVVHAHNLHPLFGWRALAAARAQGARTVLHLHNFRLHCAIGVAYRDGAPCYRCRGRDTRPGIRLRCRGTIAEAAVYGAGLALAQPRLLEHADRLVAVGAAQAERLVDLGTPPERITVLPNFVTVTASESSADGGEFALAAGRLVEEKGFDTAILAARAAGVPLVIAGAGPDERRLRSLAGAGASELPQHSPNRAGVSFAGLLGEDELASLRRRAAVVLAPSRCEETAGYAVLDALAAGVPVLASDRGGHPELVGEDATLPADDCAAWAGALAELWHDPQLRRRRGEAALARARERFGPERHLRGLIELYRS